MAQQTPPQQIPQQRVSPQTNDYSAKTDNRSLPELIRHLRDDTVQLLRQEATLAKTEMSEKSSVLMRNIGYLAVGGAVAWSGAMVLLACLCIALGLLLRDGAGLEQETVMWLSPLIVGAVVTLIGASMLGKAKKTLQSDELTPRHTIDSLQEDKEWAQRKMQ